MRALNIANILILYFTMQLSIFLNFFCVHPSVEHIEKVLPETGKLAGLDYASYVCDSRFSLGNGYMVKGRSYKPKIDVMYQEVGIASWYANKFHGRSTTSGTKYDNMLYTAAHRTLPIPSIVKVTNLKNKNSVIVVVNDRGPFKGGDKRIIDLSLRAARDLDMLHTGIAKVKVEYLHNETKSLLMNMATHQKQRALAAYKESF